MQGLDSYDNGTKQTWRGWQWNRILERLCDSPSPSRVKSEMANKTVVYLIGPADRDKDCALARGFRAENLIAADLNSNRVENVRKAGGLAIEASLQQVLMYWPASWPIDVVIADFCHGFTQDAEALVNCLGASPAVGPHTVISVNMMRGRDAHSNPHRGGFRKIIDAVPPQLRDAVPKEVMTFGLRHRGFQWWWRTLGYTVIMCEAMRGIESTVVDGEIEIPRHVMLNVFDVMRPVFYHYRSPDSGHVFDSVVCKWPLQLHFPEFNAVDPGYSERMRQSAANQLSRTASKGGNVRGKLAALRAVRTVKERRAP